MIMSDIFKLSVTLMSFVRRRCFHAFLLLYFDFRSEVMWLLFLFWTLVCPVAARFLSLKHLSVYLFIVSLPLDDCNSCVLPKECITVRLQPSSQKSEQPQRWTVLFWPFLFPLRCLPLNRSHLKSPVTAAESLLKNVKCKKFYF